MGRGQELLDAAREGDRRTVEKIIGQITKRSGPFTSLRRGAGVNVQDDNGYTPLHHACLRGHKEIVQLLLSVDASPCIVDKKGATPLHLAAFKGDVDVVNMLLNHKNPPVKIDQLTSDQETAVLIAARYGYVLVVESLLLYGADVTIRNIKDESALDLAAYYGRLETVQLLLQMRPQLVDPYKSPICRGRSFSSTPLHMAAKNGHKNVVSVLIAAGVDPNVRTYSGTPLHEAACFGKASEVRILLANGADLRAVDRRGKTVYDLLSEYSEEATRRVRKVIRDYENMSRVRATYESEEEELPPFPTVPDYSPTYPNLAGMKAPETQKNINNNDSPLSPSSSSLTKNHPQSFVKKLASKCLGLKAKFNSAPNISNSSGLESAVDKSKNSDHKSTLQIGNSKFFKRLSKKEESGEIVCNDEFDTISLDRLGTLNRDSVVNRSNRSCPGFKTSLPNISENNEISDSDEESIAQSVIITELDCNKNSDSTTNITQATNHNAMLNVFEPRNKIDRTSLESNGSGETANFVNECYESYEFANETDANKLNSDLIPKPPPRPTIVLPIVKNTIYENVVLENNAKPTPATRINIPPKISHSDGEDKVIYENFSLIQERLKLIENNSPVQVRKKPEPPKRSFIPTQVTSLGSDKHSSSSASRSSTLSSDSMIDESNLEDIFLSEKSKSFRHSKQSMNMCESINKSDVHRSYSNASDSSTMTEASAIENVDCSQDLNEKSIYLCMTGTLPNKKPERTIKKKVLFRHKTFTNMEVDRNSTNVKDLPKWGTEFRKETLANYHIRGTGHCIYSAPTVQEFLYIFNRDTLYKDVEPFSKVPNNKRDSYFETAICFCKPRPPKHHNSAEDLLKITPQEDEGAVTIDMDVLKNRHDIIATSFRCFCDSEDCKLHDKRRESLSNFIVKFSMIKKSISTPDITLDSSPVSTMQKRGLIKIKSVPTFEDPYAVVTVEDIINRNRAIEKDLNEKDGPITPIYTTMSQPSTLSSSSARPYSIKDIAEVISLNDSSSTDASLTCASGLMLRKSSSSEHSGHWSLQSCNSNVTIKSDASFVTCFEDSEEDSDGTLHSDDSSDAETIKSDISTSKRPWVHSDSFRFGSKESKSEIGVIVEEDVKESDSKFESGISVGGSSSSSSECEDDSGVPKVDVSLGSASLERGAVGGVRSGSGRRRWEEAEGTSEGDALSISSAASSCAPLHLAHHHDYSKVSPTPPKKPPRRNLSVSPTHANSPSSGYSYELRPHARSQDDLDDIQGAKHYLKHGRSVDQYVDGKLSYSEYEENHNSPRIAPVPNPRPSLKNRSQPVAITAMYENVVIKEQNPRRKLRRNQYENFEPRMENRVRKYSNQERSSLESLLDDQSMNSPSDCERYEGQRVVPLSPTHYEQPPTPEHPPPSAKQAENSIHERIRPLSQLIMEVVEEIRIRKKSQGDVTNS